MEQLDLNDIKQAVNIIAVCTSRGTFKANELERVGRLYNKLYKYVSTFNKELEEKDARSTEECIENCCEHKAPEHNAPEHNAPEQEAPEPVSTEPVSTEQEYPEQESPEYDVQEQDAPEQESS